MSSYYNGHVEREWPGSEDEDPPCTCTRVDVDRDDARGCELHDELSEYNREARRLEAEKHPPKAVESEESPECPF